MNNLEAFFRKKIDRSDINYDCIFESFKNQTKSKKILKKN